MSVTVAQVPMWLTLRGSIGHAIIATGAHWQRVVCGKVTPNGTRNRKPPGRICRHCRAGLKNVFLTGDRRDG